MDKEPIYTSEITEYTHLRKDGKSIQRRKFVAIIKGSFNNIPIGEKTEIDLPATMPIFQDKEKDKLYKRYYDKIDFHKKYPQPTL